MTKSSLIPRGHELGYQVFHAAPGIETGDTRTNGILMELPLTKDRKNPLFRNVLMDDDLNTHFI